ncbi:hypothetical protein [Streptomyces olivaceus]|uniref:hypothetical protein n=1 Tax=Streptomyces olivaceus TaxID=47716 RepID=UPI003721D9C0
MTVPAMLRRPAPLVFGAPPEQSEHGAPVVRRGELAAATRDASYLSSPNTRADVQMHAAVVTRRYAVGGGLTGIGAACDPVRILLDEGLIFGARELPKSHCRRPACRALFEAAGRQHDDLEHMRAYYRLQERYGVHLGLAIRVRHGGRPGTVVDTAGRDLLVRLDGVHRPVRCHVTRAMEYEAGSGEWVALDRDAAPAPAV